MNKVPTILGAALLAVGIVAALLFTQVRAQHEQNAQMALRVAALEAVGPAQSVASAASHSAPSPAVAAGTAAAVSSTGAPGSETNSLAAAMQQTFASEQGQEFSRVMLTASLAQQHPDLARELGLSVEEADRLLEMLARQRTEIGVDRASLRGGTQDRAARQEMARRLGEKEQAHEGELSQMLGDKYPQWKEYERAALTRQRESFQRQEIEQLRTAVSVRDRPVSDAQFDALRTAIDEEDRRIQLESRGLTDRQQLQRLADDQRRMLEAASPHLDPVQLAGYQRHLQQRMDTMRLALGTLGAMSPAAEAPPGTAAARGD